MSNSRTISGIVTMSKNIKHDLTIYMYTYIYITAKTRNGINTPTLLIGGTANMRWDKHGAY
jgi:hypothetical protein